MAGYYETMTFGMGPINLKEVTAATEHFAGTVVDKSKVLQTSAAAAKGINWGSEHGAYRAKITIDIKCTQKIAIATATHVEFKVYESADNATFGTETKSGTPDALFSFKVPISLLNKATKTPISISVLSTVSKYFCISLKFTGGSVASTVKATAGQLLITANPSNY